MSLQKYGYEWPDGTTDLQIHRTLYLDASDPLTKFDHMKAGCQLMYPEYLDPEGTPNRRRGFIWNEWTEERAKAWCGVYTPKSLEDIRVVWIGAAACGKTADSALFLVWDFCCDPLHTSVRVATNTKECLELRTWREIKRLWQLYPEGALPGNYIESEMTISCGAEGYIKGIAIKQGTIEAAIGSVKGAHGPKVRVIADELDQMPIGVMEAIENAHSGTEGFIFIGMGNPRRRYGNPLGEMATPTSGDWRSVNVNVQRWGTKHGVCQFFDGRQSPGVKHPDKFGKFLVNAKQIAKTKEVHGENSPIYWEQCIGFFPPEGLSNAVIDEPMLIQFRMTEQPKWSHQYRKGMSYDPAYSVGGNRAMIRVFAMGIDSEGRTVLCSLKTEQVKMELKADKSLSDCIGEAIAFIAQREGIQPQDMVGDCTGNQGATTDVIESHVGRGILRIQYGGKQGNGLLDKSVNDIIRAGRRAFVNKRAEMYYAFRQYARAGQIRGLDNDTCLELTQIEWKESTAPMQVEDKADVTERLGKDKSPDNADTAVQALELARYRWNFAYAGPQAEAKRTRLPGEREFTDLDNKGEFCQHDWQPEEVAVTSEV